MALNPVYGTSADDRPLEGTAGDDEIFGYGGYDALYGYGGNDVLHGGDQDDLLAGGEGDDQLYGDADNDTLDGGAGDDFLNGGDGNDELDGGADNDYLNGADGDDELYGGADNDWLVGGSGTNIVNGGSGVDTAAYGNAMGPIVVNMTETQQVTFAGGGDTLVDVEDIRGTRFGDTFTGSAEGEVFWGGITFGNSASNNDIVSMGAGDDLVRLGAGEHVADGGGDNDALQFFDNFGGGNFPGFTYSLDDQGAVAPTGQGTILATGFENLGGGGGSDELTGDGLANILAGHGDGDELWGGGGNDTLYGDGVFVAVEGGGYGIELAYSPGDDILHGGADDDALYGQVGEDQLFGDDGSDFIDGGTGNDELTGGSGADTFFFGPDSGDDIVLDFEIGQDEIQFDDSLAVVNMGDLLIEDGASGAVISWGTGDSITLEGIAAADVGGNAFGFDHIPEQAPDGVGKPDEPGRPAEPGPPGGGGGGGGRPGAAAASDDIRIAFDGHATKAADHQYGGDDFAMAMLDAGIIAT